MPASIRRRQNINNILKRKEGAFIKIHICRKGESLASIAEKYSLPLQSLLVQNDLSLTLKPVPGLALAADGNQNPGKAINICAEISASAGRDRFRRAAEKLSFCVCGRMNIFPLPAAGTPAADGAPELCRDESVLPLLALSNTVPGRGFSGSAAHELLKNPENRKLLASAAVSSAMAGGFMGLYIEFCSLFPFDTEDFLHFMSILSAAAHENGLFLLSSVEPDSAVERPLFCQELQRLCEFVVLLNFDYPACFPSPSMPLNMLRRDLKALETFITPGKFLISFSDRALDFTLPRGEVRSMSSSRALKLALSEADSIHYLHSSASAAFNYRSPDGQCHRVFSPDVRTAEEVYSLVNDYGLSGIFFRHSEHAAGPEFNYICSRFSAKKYI